MTAEMQDRSTTPFFDGVADLVRNCGAQIHVSEPAAFTPDKVLRALDSLIIDLCDPSGPRFILPCAGHVHEIRADVGITILTSSSHETFRLMSMDAAPISSSQRGDLRHVLGDEIAGSLPTAEDLERYEQEANKETSVSEFDLPDKF